MTAFGLQATAYGVFAGCWAAILPVAFLSTSYYPSFVPKYAVLLLMAGAGIVPLGRLAWSRTTRWIGLSLVGFLFVGLVSALVSAAPNVGIFGLYQWGTGWLFWLACAGAFAVGASLRGSDLSWVRYGLLAGCAANALMAVFQMVGKPTSTSLEGYAANSQADGFLGNPIHLEGLMLGALVLVAPKVCDTPRRWWWAPLLFGAALEMTSERLFIPILLVVFAAAIAIRGRRGLLFSALAGVGCLVGYLVGGSALSSRVASGTAETTFGLRFQEWRTALEGLPHHLLIGAGPGELISGTAPYISLAFGKALDGRLFADAHDLFVEVLVTTGVVGFVCFVAWLGLTLRWARDAFVGFALALFAVTLVEPLNVGVAPLAFLALGAGLAGWLTSHERGGLAWAGLAEVRPDPTGVRPGRVFGRVVTTCAVAVSLALAVTMVLGDYWYTKTQTSLQQLAAAKTANRLLPYWEESASALGFYWRYEYSVQHGARRSLDLVRAERAYVSAARRDPSDPTVWWYVGEVDQLLGQTRAARAAYDRSLRNDPWYPSSLAALAKLDLESHQWTSAAALYHKLGSLQPLTKSLLRDERSAQAHGGAERP